MQNDKNIHIVVLRVNILSPSKNQVMNGKTKYDRPNPIKRTDHTEDMWAYRYLEPKYPHRDIGTAKARQMNSVLYSLKYSENWPLALTQARACNTKIKSTP